LNRRSFLVFFGTVLLAVPFFFPAGAHCPGEIPETKITYPEPGMAVQEACFPSFGTCLTDTFHVEKLMSRLVEDYKASKHAIFGYVKKVDNYLTFDTTIYHGEPYYIDTFQTERISISVEAELKGALPVRDFSFIDRWLAFRFNPMATTYSTMIDTPFIAFFDQYDSIKHLGLGPMDGCFFEPTVFSIYDGRIHKKGLVGERMPGVSVTVEEFLAAVGHEAVPVPQVGIRTAPRRRGIVAPRNRFHYDLNGRRLVFRNDGARTFSVTPGADGKIQHGERRE
jgi:hypothetical protein